MTEHRIDPHIELWDAINDYAEACGGDTSDNILSSRRMRAVTRVEQAVRSLRTENAVMAMDKLDIGAVHIARRHDGWTAYMEPASVLKTMTFKELLDQIVGTERYCGTIDNEPPTDQTITVHGASDPQRAVVKVRT